MGQYGLGASRITSGGTFVYRCSAASAWSSALILPSESRPIASRKLVTASRCWSKKSELATSRSALPEWVVVIEQDRADAFADRLSAKWLQQQSGVDGAGAQRNHCIGD